MQPLVDIGANLVNRAFRGDLPAVLDRARAAGVAEIVVTGTSAPVSAAAAELAAERGLYATAGIHPHHARDADADALGQIRALQQHPRVVAVGECGLDYDRDFSPRPDQRACFAAQLAIAAELGKPVFLHERAASADFQAILREHRPRLRAAVVHCFTGTRDELEAYLALDLHIGVTGWICDERRGGHLAELVATIPADRLMLETDAPYLVPRTLPSRPRDRRNEPAFLPWVLAAVATAAGRPPERVAAETTATARAFFGLPGAAAMVLVASLLALPACSGKSPPVETMPTLPDPGLIQAEVAIIEKGELILRSAGAEIGRERFEIGRAGDRLQVAVEVKISRPPYQSIELAMRVDAASWAIDGFDANVDGCKAHLRNQAGVMELAAEYADGEHVVVDREPREHAGHFISMRPTVTQTAICAIADDRAHAVDSYPPWYVVRTAPRAATEHPSADGARRLDKVVVDGLIDVYCDGPRLAIVHYPKHAFISARTEYDALAQTLTVADPIDEPWAGELGCPPAPERAGEDGKAGA